MLKLSVRSAGSCHGIKIAITRVKIRAKIRSLEGKRLEFMAEGFAQCEIQRALAGMRHFAKYIATGRESVPNRRQSADRRPKFSNPGSTELRTSG